MELKKEDLVRIRTFEDKFYYAIRDGFLDEEEEVVEAIEEVVAEIVEPTPEELEAIAKAKKKAELEAELAALEE